MLVASVLRSSAMQQLGAPAGRATLMAAQRALPGAVAASRHQLLPAGGSQHNRALTVPAAAATELAATGEDPLAGFGQRPPKVFAAFSVYKSKGAMSVKPVPPVWSLLPGKEANDTPAYKLDREGGLMFELAAAISERKYDWEKKVIIQLRPEELAALVAEPDREHNLYHDTFKSVPGREGVLTKTFKWSQAPDGRAYFINASASNKDDGSRNSASVSLSTAEFYALKRLIDFSLPHMYGFDVAFTRY